MSTLGLAESRENCGEDERAVEDKIKSSKGRTSRKLRVIELEYTANVALDRC